MDFITETGGSESLYIIQANLSVRGHAVAYVVVGHCASSRKVAGPIPDGVVGATLWLWCRHSL